MPRKRAARASKRTVERGVRLSESLLWRAQRAYFREQDPLAWSLGPVPSYVTSNAFIARAMARVVSAYLDDVGARGSATPVTILELGAGSGRFAYAFLRELDARRRENPRAPAFRYMLTDLDEAPVAALRDNARFSPFVDRGLLGFAVLDAQDARAGSVVPADAPLVVIANYVFDGIPADAFEVAGGKLHESLVRIM